MLPGVGREGGYALLGTLRVLDRLVKALVHAEYHSLAFVHQLMISRGHGYPHSLQIPSRARSGRGNAFLSLLTRPASRVAPCITAPSLPPPAALPLPSRCDAPRQERNERHVRTTGAVTITTFRLSPAWRGGGLCAYRASSRKGAPASCAKSSLRRCRKLRPPVLRAHRLLGLSNLQSGPCARFLLLVHRARKSITEAVGAPYA